jgi:MarR family transcriptional regulator, temperature-dependent positive regulator of motility
MHVYASKAVAMPNANRWSRKYANVRLEQVARAARDRADKVYKRECGIDINHIRILRIVAAMPQQPVNYVVRESHFERSLVSRIIGRLVKLQLLERVISPVDARQFLLVATVGGADLVRRANILGDALDADLLGVLTKQEREIFEKCLAKLLQWRPKE